MPNESAWGHAHTTVIDSSGVEYDVYKLIDLAQELVVKQVAVADLRERAFEDKCWRNGDEGKESLEIGAKDIYDAVVSASGDYDEAIKANSPLARHIFKTMIADPSYPIILGPQGNIIDGMHRMTKAIIENREEIPVRQFNTMPQGAIYARNGAFN